MLLRESILIIKNKYSLKVLQILTKFLLKFKEIVIENFNEWQYQCKIPRNTGLKQRSYTNGT